MNDKTADRTWLLFICAVIRGVCAGAARAILTWLLGH